MHEDVNERIMLFHKTVLPCSAWGAHAALAVACFEATCERHFHSGRLYCHRRGGLEAKAARGREEEWRCASRGVQLSLAGHFAGPPDRPTSLWRLHACLPSSGDGNGGGRVPSLAGSGP
jgi:hypothetical protein